jgi:sigma-B regulation protein RsbU (phosphoserine phosphatase)
MLKNGGRGDRRSGSEVDRRKGGGGDGGYELLLQLSFPSVPDRLRLVRPMVRASAQLCGFTLEDARDVVLAVDEACANIIEHAYGWRGDAEIVLSIFRVEDGIQIQLRDFAPPVSLRSVHPRKLDEVEPGGLGTHFIRSIMDDTRFMRAPDGEGNILELTKRALAPS